MQTNRSHFHAHTHTHTTHGKEKEWSAHQTFMWNIETKFNLPLTDTIVYFYPGDIVSFDLKLKLNNRSTVGNKECDGAIVSMRQTGWIENRDLVAYAWLFLCVYYENNKNMDVIRFRWWLCPCAVEILTIRRSTTLNHLFHILF